MADADVDGSHIRTLLLTFFYRYFEPLIQGGHIFIAQPPLYRLQKGKNIKYAYTDTDRDRVLAEMIGQAGETKAKKQKEKNLDAVKIEKNTGGESEEESEVGEKVGGISIQRYKGLGEINPNQLWETTMNPETRIMLKVNIEDAQAADKMFDVLMGSEVEPRRRFIQTHAKNVKNLDV